ncbi:serine/threonine-protein kinase RsbW [Streptomyces canus]|uniref:Serine/threonine-protein kinase RsbW n=1 Tax=Streptomyces canus TaxID=58343 RepID=A0AAW8FF35_9ACTN|nr:ATP-binding protein [Streptomyces canus]MDQ0907418.1 serine/threonine-protein kinase RsbW [Streptomyces canus]
MNPQAQLLHARTALYPRDRRSVAVARDLTRITLTDWGVTERSDDVLLCVSELATNALLHGVTPNRCFRLDLVHLADGVLRVEVHDSGSGEIRIPDATPESEHGRGLLLVAALADDWGVRERDSGKVVWCDFAIRAPAD